MKPTLESFQQIVVDLNHLRDSPVQVFGADGHRFCIHPPLSEKKLRDFEDDHQVRLPEDYRTFLGSVGRGGAGPSYGIFNLGETDDGFEFRKWKEGDWFVGSL